MSNTSKNNLDITEIFKEFVELIKNQEQGADKRQEKNDLKMDKLAVSIDKLAEAQTALMQAHIETKKDRELDTARVGRSEIRLDDVEDKVSTISDTVLILNERQVTYKDARNRILGAVTSIVTSLLALALAIAWGLK